LVQLNLTDDEKKVETTFYDTTLHLEETSFIFSVKKIIDFFQRTNNAGQKYLMITFIFDDYTSCDVAIYFDIDENIFYVSKISIRQDYGKIFETDYLKLPETTILVDTYKSIMSFDVQPITEHSRYCIYTT
jgi:hypothetical protein